ncbi:DUF5682 family protein [Streptomyces sp. NPDC050617]|uniref:DUF5682 family protein n=1 Tax=Streptomyces sp. NPDC050617 TaxID=3154628 RepID=UPI003423DEA0
MLLGVRHHGPGSARAVRGALDACEPAAVLIEGPPEAEAVIGLAGEDGMRPPVALLAHAVDDPGRAAFWPLAGFSPEWVAIRWALERGVPVRFIDLPAAVSLAMDGAGRGAGDEAAGEAGREERDDERDDECDEAGGEASGAADGEADGEVSGGTPGAAPDAGQLRVDPLAVLAETAGHDDPERWWEDVVEHRGGNGRPGPGRPEPSRAGALAPFEALAEAMAALRGEYGHGGHDRDLVREAHMRLRLREARREFGDGVAVVCGAWHVPALAETVTVAADRQRLKGLPKVKTEISWVPWTHRRLSRHSGYGAGIASPGWYAHLFDAPDRPIERWMTKVARLLRAEDQPVSSAHVIEAVRLADTLATMRGRPLAGLAETTDAIRAVLCEGSDVPLALVQDRLVVGDVLGEVPDSAPATPLQRDLARAQRSLRLKPEAAERKLELDLRKDTDAARSRLLHRLRLLGIEWGEAVRSREGLGTFRETWRLRWEPELSVKVAEAGVWGTTVLAAATAKAESRAAGAPTLADVTGLAEQCLLAGLTDALPVVLRALADRAALDADVGNLAQALPALVRSVRYGDVRRTDAAALREVAAGLAERVFVGLPPACAGLDADASATMRGHLDSVHTAVGLLAEATEAKEAKEAKEEIGATEATEAKGVEDAGGAGIRERWSAVLRGLCERGGIPGLIRGRAVRLLLDDGRLADGEAARLMGLALSPGTEPPEAAAWIEGFVGSGGSGGMLLIHDERLLALVDGWLTRVPADAFTSVLPLLRRTFGSYDPGVRRTLGELVRRGGPDAPPPGSGAGAQGFGPGLDAERAAAVLPTLHALLGTGTGMGMGMRTGTETGTGTGVPEPLPVPTQGRGKS